LNNVWKHYAKYVFLIKIISTGEITEKLRGELGVAEQNIQFLNSIIVDLQVSNTEMKKKLEILLAGGDLNL